MDFASLGIRIRRQRKLLRLTQDQLAERAGISVSFLGHIERGTRKAGLETLVQLANALGMSTDVLLQESLNDGALRGDGSGSIYRQRVMLQEISRILQKNPDTWEE